MRAHQKTHVRIDDYECDLCDKKFDRIQSLNRHRRRIHKETIVNKNETKHDSSQTISVTKILLN